MPPVAAEVKLLWQDFIFFDVPEKKRQTDCFNFPFTNQSESRI